MATTITLTEPEAFILASDLRQAAADLEERALLRGVRQDTAEMLLGFAQSRYLIANRLSAPRPGTPGASVTTGRGWIEGRLAGAEEAHRAIDRHRDMMVRVGATSNLPVNPRYQEGLADHAAALSAARNGEEEARALLADLVQAAVAAGVTKYQVGKWTGLARATVDKWARGDR